MHAYEGMHWIQYAMVHTNASIHICLNKHKGSAHSAYTLHTHFITGFTEACMHVIWRPKVHWHVFACGCDLLCFCLCLLLFVSWHFINNVKEQQCIFLCIVYLWIQLNDLHQLSRFLTHTHTHTHTHTNAHIHTHVDSCHFWRLIVFTSWRISLTMSKDHNLAFSQLGTQFLSPVGQAIPNNFL